MKEAMLLALNAAGVKTEGLSDAEILAAHSALAMKPVLDANKALSEQIKALADGLAANSKAEATRLAETIAAAPGALLKADELAGLPIERLRELAANAAKAGLKAAPVVPGLPAEADDEESKAFLAYSVNEQLKAASGAQH